MLSVRVNTSRGLASLRTASLRHFTKDASAETVEEEEVLGNKGVFQHAKNSKPIYTSLKGKSLLNSPSLNKGAAFTAEERQIFGLKGLLPYDIHTLDMQCERAYNQVSERETAIGKYTFLASLRDQNIVLYYNLIARHLEEFLPIIYTPTVGTAIEKYSIIWRRATGLFLSYPNKNQMREIMLSYKRPRDTDLIVVTDSEGILGIGDQGVGGVLIAVGKGNIYTLGGGVNPDKIMPIVLDVGTNNQALLDDPLYLGVRKPRLRGKEYDDFVDEFCRIVREWYPDAFLHFEDFGVANAGRILNKYRPIQSVFNDDMQGTAAVVLAGLMSAANVTKTELKDHRIMIFGLGTAGLGIADGIRTALEIDAKLTPEEAASRFYAVDRFGLLTTDHTHLIREGQEPYLRDASEVSDWERDSDGQISLLEAVKKAKPTILIGCSTRAGAFNEEIVREMCSYTERPIIFPLSNPTPLAEATPADLTHWSKGRALIATGSPFPPVEMPNGQKHKLAESNNALVYPGLGLGVIVSKASKLSDGMITAGVKELAKMSPALEDPYASLLASLKDVRHVSVKIATAVANQARAEGVSQLKRSTDFTEDEVRQAQWDPVYRRLELVDSTYIH